MANHEIVDCRGGRDAEVTTLILDIQRSDVGLHVPVEEQPELLDLATAYRNGAYWLAVDGDAVVGTIGMVRYGDSPILKKLFVRHDHRGPSGAGRDLYDTVLAWTKAQGLAEILLDTPAVETRSHAFYQRRGFRIAERSALPAGYAFPDRDSLIFRLDLRT